MKRASFLFAILGLFAGQAWAAAPTNDYLVKLAPNASVKSFSLMAAPGAKVESLAVDNWIRVKVPEASNHAKVDLKAILASNPNVVYVQPNYKLHLLENYQIKDKKLLAQIQEFYARKKKKPSDGNGGFPGMPGNSDDPVPPKDDPAIPGANTASGTGADPLVDKQWGMMDNHTHDAWAKTKGSPDVVVAVIDTGVDYTHEDLVANLWRNPGESGMDSQGRDKSSNGIDDDNNGFVDDVIGWDFADNDSKPFDRWVPPMQLLTGEGNPGHGTHCAGNVAARDNNGKGIAGVAPNVRIMAMRFLNEKGQGDTAGAVKAIKYAVDMGARVLSNSWGSEGEDTDQSANQALQDAIKYAASKNVLFVAAAGNGHNGVGYDNDSDPKPGYPASYNIDNIVSVAAIDKNDQLGSFSNWGARTVHIAAPGVAIFSTIPASRYSDTVIDLPEFGITATWDGTSMATPHVSGAAALYWSLHPEKSYAEVKAALINSAKKLDTLAGKMVSGGKLNVLNLMNQ